MLTIADIIGLLRLKDELSPGLKAIATNLKAVSTQMNQIGLDLLPVSAAMTAVGAGAMKAAIDFESSFAGVRKTVDATEQQFTQLSQSFRNMAKEIPVNVNELNRIAEAGGQLGVKTKDIEGFTRTMAAMGVSTNLSSVQAGESLAQIANIINNQAGPQYDRLGATIVDLGNKGASTEAQIVDFGLRIAGAGNMAGMSEAQILGLGASLANLGTNAEAGGTAISQLIMKMSNAVATGKGLENFLAVTGMKAADFKKLFEKDATEAILKFVEALGRLKGSDAINVLDKMGLDGARMSASLLKMASSGDQVRNTINQATEAWKNNSALMIEAEKRYQTMESQLILLKNRIYDVAIQLGTAMKPAFDAVLQAVNGLIPYIEKAVQGFGQLDAPVQLVIIAIGGFVAALAPLLLLFGTVASSVGALITVLGSLSFLLGPLAVLATTVAVAFLGWEFGKIIGDLKLFEGGLVSVTDKLGLFLARLMGGQPAVDAYRANMAAFNDENRKAGLGLDEQKVAVVELQGPMIGLTQAQIEAQQAAADLAAKFSGLTGDTDKAEKAAKRLAEQYRQGLVAGMKAAGEEATKFRELNDEIQNRFQPSVATASTNILKLMNGMTAFREQGIEPSAESLKTFIDGMQQMMAFGGEVEGDMDMLTQAMDEYAAKMVEANRVAKTWTDSERILNYELNKTQVELDAAKADLQEAIAFEQQVASQLYTIGEAMGGVGGTIATVAGGIFDVFAALDAATLQAAENFERYGDSAMTTGQKIQAGLGAAVAAIAAFQSGSVTKGAIGGAMAGAAFGPVGAVIGGVAGAIFGFFGGKKKKEEERKKQLEQDIKRFDDLLAQITQVKMDFLIKGVEGLGSMFTYAASRAEPLAGELDRLGTIGVAQFEALKDSGLSTVEAMNAMAPALDAALAALEATGQTATGPFAELLDFRTKVLANEDLVNAIDGWNAAMSALRSNGMLTQAMFSDMDAQLQVYIADLQSQGFTQAQVTALTLPALFQLYQAQEQYGFKLDETTQALVDQAEASGAFDDMKDPLAQLVELQELMLQTVAALVKAFGQDLPAAVQKYIDSLKNAPSNLPPPPGPPGEGGWPGGKPPEYAEGGVVGRSGGMIARVGEVPEAITPLEQVYGKMADIVAAKVRGGMNYSSTSAPVFQLDASNVPVDVVVEKVMDALARNNRGELERFRMRLMGQVD